MDGIEYHKNLKKMPTTIKTIITENVIKPFLGVFRLQFSNQNCKLTVIVNFTQEVNFTKMFTLSFYARSAQKCKRESSLFLLLGSPCCYSSVSAVC